MGRGEDGDGKRLGGTDQLVSCCDSERETSLPLSTLWSSRSYVMVMGMGMGMGI